MRKTIAAPLVVLALIGLVPIGAALASHSQTGSFTACYEARTGELRLIKEDGLPRRCAAGWTMITFPSGATTAGDSGGHTQITWPAGHSVCDGAEYTLWVPSCEGDPDPNQEGVFTITLNPEDYPTGAAFRFKVSFLVQFAGLTGCIRVYDLDAGQPVPGTAVCRKYGGPETRYFHFTSGQLALGPGAHRYGLQTKTWDPNTHGSGGMLLYDARLLVTW